MLRTFQVQPEMGGRLSPAEICNTADLLQIQLHLLEQRCRMGAEEEALITAARATLHAACADLAVVQQQEERATAELTQTLARLRSTQRTSITQSQSHAQLPAFPFPRRLQQLSFQTSTPPASPTPAGGRGSPATAPPGAGARAAARQSMPSPLARLALGARLAHLGAAQCSSPRGPLRPDADSPTGSEGATSRPSRGLPPSRPGTPMTDAEAALARTLHEFFTSESAKSVSSSVAAGGVDSPTGATDSPARGRLSMLDPRLRTVALGAHVVTAARAEGDEEDVPESPGSCGSESDVDAQVQVVDARMSAAAQLSAALAGRLERAAYVRVSALRRADRLGEHEIASGAEDMPAEVQPEEEEEEEELEEGEVVEARVATPTLLDRLGLGGVGRKGTAVGKLAVSRGSTGGGDDTRKARGRRRGWSVKNTIIGRQISMGRRRLSGRPGRRFSLVSSRGPMDAYSVESVVAVAEGN